jgi:uncharacterized DUF497 family protein
MKFEWDENKNNINQLKHGIEFEYAKAASLVPKQKGPYQITATIH